MGEGEKKDPSLLGARPEAASHDDLAVALPAALAGKGAAVALPGISSNGIKCSPPCWLTQVDGWGYMCQRSLPAPDADFVACAARPGQACQSVQACLPRDLLACCRLALAQQSLLGWLSCTTGELPFECALK